MAEVMEDVTQSLGCARCGDCCERIYLSVDMSTLRQWSSATLDTVPDPRTDEGWAWWLENDNTWSDTEWDREIIVERYDPRGDRRLNADFLTVHWHEVTEELDSGRDTYFTCDQFDPMHRLCRAHAERPPVCSDYPWYGKAPTRKQITKTGSRCSFLLDLRPEDRPEGARPLIPIEVVKR